MVHARAFHPFNVEWVRHSPDRNVHVGSEKRRCGYGDHDHGQHTGSSPVHRAWSTKPSSHGSGVASCSAVWLTRHVAAWCHRAFSATTGRSANGWLLAGTLLLFLLHAGNFLYFFVDDEGI